MAILTENLQTWPWNCIFAHWMTPIFGSPHQKSPHFFGAHTEWPPFLTKSYTERPLFLFSGGHLYVTFIFECPLDITSFFNVFRYIIPNFDTLINNWFLAKFKFIIRNIKISCKPGRVGLPITRHLKNFCEYLKNYRNFSQSNTTNTLTIYIPPCDIVLVLVGWAKINIMIHNHISPTCQLPQTPMPSIGQDNASYRIPN